MLENCTLKEFNEVKNMWLKKNEMMAMNDLSFITGVMGIDVLKYTLIKMKNK